ncbi:MAG TPA: hypothetical protein VGB85_33200, partial [Nannocystis sp.]
MPSPPRLFGALLTPLLLGCPGTGSEGSNSSSTTEHITSVTATDTSSSDPTNTTPSTVTDTPTDTTSTSPCEDGAVQCTSVDERLVCKGGKWVDEPCAEGQGCDGFGDCSPCTCEVSSCIDEDTINACSCFDVTPQACDAGTACDELN